MDLLEDAFHQGDLIGVVVNYEVGGEADGLAIHSQPASAHAVEGAHVKAGSVFAQQAGGTFAHFARRLVGKSHGQHPPGRHPVFDHKVSDAMRDDARLAASRACENEHGAIAVHHGGPLRFVQTLEKFRLRGDSFHRSEFSIRSPALSISASPEPDQYAMVFALGGTRRPEG